MIRLSAVLRHVALAFVCIAITRPTSVGFAAMAKAQGDNGVAVITGKMRVTNPFILEDAAGPYEWHGWPSDLDSLRFEAASGAVTGGRLLVWAADDQELFPTGYGPDGQLFSADDPLGPLAAGWTVVDLDQQPFERLRQHTVEVPIVETLATSNDLSRLSYTQAFDALVKELRLRYTFTTYKHIDWPALVDAIRPQVQQAEQDQSREEFNIALLRFVASFQDGHMAVSLPDAYFKQQTEGGLGLVLDHAPAGTAPARPPLPHLPAAQAGIKTGAKILDWDGQPIDTALAETELLFAPQSSPHAIRLQQLRYLPRR